LPQQIIFCQIINKLTQLGIAEQTGVEPCRFGSVACNVIHQLGRWYWFYDAISIIKFINFRISWKHQPDSILPGNTFSNSLIQKFWAWKHRMSCCPSQPDSQKLPLHSAS